MDEVDKAGLARVCASYYGQYKPIVDFVEGCEALARRRGVR